MAKSVLKDTINALNGVIDGLERSDATVKNDLKELANKLSMIDDDVNLPLHDPEVRNWLVRVLDVVNDFHELVDDLAGVNQGSERMNKLISWATGRRSQPTDKIKEIRVTVDRVVDTKPPPRTRKQAHSNVKGEGTVQESMIGREEEEKKITQQLLSNSDSPVILPIFGIQGLGKTALAKLVYRNVKELFDLKVWVQSGESFHVKSIVQQVTQQELEIDDDDQLQNHLWHAIGGRRRYLLVVDDVKSADQKEWDKFTEILPSGGSILITTPSAQVARITGTVPPVALRGLSEDESWSLFKKIASSSEKSDTTNEDINRKMVEKCKGVPRAIQIMGSLWRTPAASERNIESMEENFLEELELIYCNELPFPLKLCFAFCSLFPNNDVIDVPRLINLWIGERFVLPRSTDLEYEGVGEEYFRDLYGRSIFQDVQEDELGNPISCRMHPLMHYLAVFVARHEYISVHPDGKGIKETVRHASFDFRLDVSSVIPESLSQELLTILLPAARQSRLPNDMKMSTSTAEKIFAKFKSLRVLDVHDLGMKTVPKSISNLGELRYLDLSRNNMEKLPSSITKLNHLQTLKLSHCRELKELPKDLDDLARLRHLEIDGCLDLTHMPECITKMTLLRTLTLFMGGNRKSTSTGGIRGLATLNKLRGVLEIAHLERCVAPDAAEANLQEKKALQRLILRWDHDDDNVIKDADASEEDKFLESLKPPEKLKALFLMGYGGTKLSHWQSSMSSLQDLVQFSLINCCNCQSLLPLHHLESLKILELRKLNSLEFIVDNSDESGATARSGKKDYFGSLKKLTISDCPNLASWWKKEIPVESSIPSFSSISMLDIQYCPKLKRMPLCVELEKLVVVSSSVTPVLDTINKSTSPHPFSKLKSMLIANINHEAPPKQLFKKFTSLQRLHIRECHRLKSLPEGFRNLTSLQELIIENCKELDLMKDSSEEWRDLKNLRALTIRGIPKLECLPKGLECVTTLQELHLHDCSKLNSLSDNMDKLVSLKTLDISDCYNLASLPQGLKSLTSLDTLTIKDCPKLMPRCQPDTGDDWPQIEKIKNRSIWQTSQQS